MERVGMEHVLAVASADEARAAASDAGPALVLAANLTALKHPEIAELCGRDGTTVICLHRVLLGVALENRHQAWRGVVSAVLAAVENVELLGIAELALTADDLSYLAKSPGMTQMVARGCAIGDPGATAIATHLPNLTTLDLGYNRVGDAGATAIATHLPNLTTLDLGYNRVGDAGATAIATHLPNLTTLDLGLNGVGDAGATAIATHLPNLTRLHLRDNHVDHAGATAIANGLPNLTTLDLGNNRVDHAGVTAIANRLPNLTTLHLRDNVVGDRGVTAIANGLPNLTTLDLRDSFVGDGVTAIANGLPNLTTLHLAYNGVVGDAGVTAIATHLPNLTTLNLRDNSIGHAGATAIATHLPNLTTLHLKDSRVGDAGATAIANGLPNLTTLHLWNNNVGDAGATAIATHLPNLTTLDLWNNSVGAAGATAIANGLPNLTTLNLGNNRFGHAGATAIANGLPNLTTLNLGNNRFGHAGATAIANGLPNLTTLNLGGNGVGDAGATAIATHLPNLTTLDLGANSVGDAGATAIATHLRNLTTLYLWNNNVGDAGATAIATHLPNLTTLYLWNNSVGDAGLMGVFRVLTSTPALALRTLDLRDNPGLVDLALPELSESTDATAILAAARRLLITAQDALVPFGEAKLLVLGDARVGKTSLVQALVDRLPCDPQQQSTQGVDHKIWVTPWAPQPGGSTQLNIWDFGGQQILHQTHRYFLSQRCIYLVVLDRDRSDSGEIVTQWLRTIAARGQNSPVVIVVNKCDDGAHQVDFDLQRDAAEYGAATVLNVSCLKDPSIPADSPAAPNPSLVPLREELARLIADDDRLDSVHRGVPRAWVRVRDEIRELAADEQVLGVERYVSICLAADRPDLRVSHPDEQRGLLRLLDQIGVVVAHGLTDQTTVLTGLTLLDPNWFTDAVYALLSDGTVRERGGVFDRALLGEILRRDRYRADQYPDDRLDVVIDMLQTPELALSYRLPDPADATGLPRFLAPGALTRSAPTQTITAWDPQSLRFRVRYELLPAGLLTQFQVVAHPHLGVDPQRWRDGCVLTIHGCQVLIDGQPSRNVLELRVAGPSNRRSEALAVVRALLDQVHQRFPEAGPSERVPLPEDPELDIGYQHLRTLEDQHGPEYRHHPEGAQRAYEVGELLTGVRIEVHQVVPGASISVRASGGSQVVIGPDNTQTQTTALPAVPPAVVEPEAGRSLGRTAARFTIGPGVGMVLGAGGAGLYLAGQGQGWPLATVGLGVTVGGLVGAGCGLLWSLTARR